MTENEHDVDIPNTVLIDLDKIDKFDLLHKKEKGKTSQRDFYIEGYKIAPGRFN